MNPLPMPVRLAAGLVATAVEQARELPRYVVEFPVTAVSQALQASMRVQQKVTELAIKGDRMLGTLHPVEEKPSWATFDEDEPAARNGSVTTLRPQAPGTQTAEPPTVEPEHVDTPAEVAARITAAHATGTATADPPVGPEEPAAGSATGVAARTTADAALHTPPPVVETPPHDTGPNALPGYAELTIPQLRGKLRHLDLDALRALLEYETTHDDRAPFVTMLSNRIATISAE